MSLPFQGPGAALAQLDPEQIGWARAAAARLAAAGFETSVTPVQSDDAEHWYQGLQFDFAPLAEPILRGAPAEHLMHLLSANEAVLAEIEQALGLAAEFSSCGPRSGHAPAITLRRDGAAVARIVVLAPVEPLPAPPPPPVLAPLMCNAARLPMTEAEQLAGGDMVLLLHGPWPLAEAAGGALAAPELPALGYDPVRGAIVPLLAAPPPSAQGASLPMTSASSLSGLTVPVAVHLADIAVSQTDLARVAETGTLDIGAVSEGLRVLLSIGGRPIGHGEIVRLGDRFAVLLEQTASATEPPEPAAAALTEDAE
jgi:flagellar motor switch/type III secretory pathway protein FliN